MNHQTAQGMRNQEYSEQSGLALVSIVGSAGGSTAMREILSHLPANFPAPILYLQHLRASYFGELAEVLQDRTVLRVRWARQGDRLRAGVVYLCPAGRTFIVLPGGTIALAPAETPFDMFRSADRFFASMAASYAHRGV